MKEMLFSVKESILIVGDSMKNSLKEYIKEVDTLLEKKQIPHLEEIQKKHLLQIKFYQHERLIHLLVTFMTSLLTMLVLLYTLMNPNLGTFLLFLILFCMLVPYLFHYYHLENGVQKMYKQYFLLQEKK